jgi:hypothetical protein
MVRQDSTSACPKDRLIRERADWQAGRVRVVRGGKKLARNRHHLAATRLTEPQWRNRWEAGRWFLSADGESGKRLGNETIRVNPDGQVSLKLPAPLAHLANAGHGRYTLTSVVVSTIGAPSGPTASTPTAPWPTVFIWTSSGDAGT